MHCSLAVLMDVSSWPNARVAGGHGTGRLRRKRTTPGRHETGENRPEADIRLTAGVSFGQTTSTSCYVCVNVTIDKLLGSEKKINRATCTNQEQKSCRDPDYSVYCDISNYRMLRY